MQVSSIDSDTRKTFEEDFANLAPLPCLRRSCYVLLRDALKYFTFHRQWKVEQNLKKGIFHFCLSLPPCCSHFFILQEKAK